jgi:PST family polysaccharide transporter
MADKFTSFDRTQIDSSELKAKAIKSAGITISFQLVGYIFQTIGTFWIARLVTPEDFGLVTMVTIFSLLLQNLGENGFTEYVIQKDKIDRTQLSTLFWINTSLNLTLTILFILLAPIMAWLYKEERIVHIAIFMSLSIIFGALPIQHIAMLKRKMNFFYTSTNELIAVLLSTGLAIGLAYIGFGYWAIAIRRTSQPLFMAIGGWILFPWIPGLPKKSKEIKKALKFVFNTYGNFTVSYVGRNLDKFLIGKIYGTSSLGFYDRAYHLAMLLPNQLSGSLTGIAISALSKIRSDKIAFRRYFSKILSVIAFVAIFISITLALTGKDIVIILLGEQWENAGNIFQAFAPGIGIMVIYATSGWVHLSLGRADRWFRWGLIRMACATTAILIGLNWGPKGVAIAYSTFLYITLFPALIYAGKPVGISYYFIYKYLWRYFAIGLLTFFSFMLLVNHVSIIETFVSEIHAIHRILLYTCTIAILYFCATIAIFRNLSPFTMVLDLSRSLKKR